MFGCARPRGQGADKIGCGLPRRNTLIFRRKTVWGIRIDPKKIWFFYCYYLFVYSPGPRKRISGWLISLDSCLRGDGEEVIDLSFLGANFPIRRQVAFTRKRQGMETEIVFIVEESDEGGFEARALGQSIFTEADSLEELRAMIKDAVACHFDSGKGPKIIRLHFVRDEVIAA